jgi:VIT1/CCC1 family predicted Fe2+/Mn2+ transporter
MYNGFGGYDMNTLITVCTIVVLVFTNILFFGWPLYWSNSKSDRAVWFVWFVITASCWIMAGRIFGWW